MSFSHDACDPVIGGVKRRHLSKVGSMVGKEVFERITLLFCVIFRVNVIACIIPTLGWGFRLNLRT